MRVASGARGLLLVLAVLAVPVGAARGQEPDPAPGRDGARALVFREQLAPFAGPARRILGEDYERFRATLDALAAQEARQRGLAGEVDFSFSADETGDFSGGPGNETLFGLRAGARLGGGGYRSRVRLLGDMRALIHDDVFEQDFSRVRLGYDHRRTDHLGAFAFIERYSDDAMSIASRYEIGGGVSMGVDLWPRRDDEAGARALAHLASAGAGGFRCGVERLRAGFDPAGGAAPPPGCVSLGAAPAPSPVAADGGNQAAAGVPTAVGGRGDGAAVGAPAFHRPAPGGPRPDPAVFDGLLDVVDPLERGLAARQAMVSLSLGVGVFSEFENALIETRVSRLDSPAGGPADSVVDLPTRYLRVPGRHRYRFLLWPTIAMRPLSSLSIEFIPSFKLPISSPRRLPDGLLAYRMDWFARIDWRPRRDDSLAGRTKLFVKFDYYKNPGPPVVADALSPEAGLEPLFYHRTGGVEEAPLRLAGALAGPGCSLTRLPKRHGSLQPSGRARPCGAAGRRGPQGPPQPASRARRRRHRRPRGSSRSLSPVRARLCTRPT